MTRKTTKERETRKEEETKKEKQETSERRELRKEEEGEEGENGRDEIFELITSPSLPGRGPQVTSGGRKGAGRWSIKWMI